MRASLKLLLIGYSIPALSWWHAYDFDKKIAKDCPSQSVLNVSAFTSPLKKQEVEKWRLWPGLIEAQDLLKGETMYGFREGMEAIFKNQFRKNCSDAKFVISNGWPQGFGSEVHVVGNGLAIALNMNRIYVINPDGPLVEPLLNNTWQIDNEFCRARKKKTLDCYFESWTNCDVTGALAGRTIADLRKVSKRPGAIVANANKDMRTMRWCEPVRACKCVIVYESLYVVGHF